MTHDEETTQTQPQSRQEKRQEKESREQKSSSASEKGRKRERIRMVPIWARLLIVLAILVLSLIGGLLTGYTLVGDGDSLQVLNWQTWENFLEFIQGE